MGKSNARYFRGNRAAPDLENHQGGYGHRILRVEMIETRTLLSCRVKSGAELQLGWRTAVAIIIAQARRRERVSQESVEYMYRSRVEADLMIARYVRRVPSPEI